MPQTDLRNYEQVREFRDQLAQPDKPRAIMATKGQAGIEVYIRWFNKWQPILDDYEKQNPYVTFRPWIEGAKMFDQELGQTRPCYNPSQAKVWKAWQGGERFLLVTGGTRSGKTLMGGLLVNHCLLSGPNKKIIVLGTSLRQHSEQTQDAIWRTRCHSELSPKQRPWGPDGKGFGDDRPTYVVSRPEWGKGRYSRAIFLTWEMGIEELRGHTCDGIWVNESPAAREWITEMRVRVSTKLGWCMVTATFVDGDDCWDELDPTVNENSPYKMIMMSMHDNPAQPKEEIARVTASMTPEDAEAFVMGIPRRRGGRAYKNFIDGPPFVFEPGEEPPVGRCWYYEVADFHEHKPIAWQRWAMDEAGVAWCLDELWHPRGMAEFCQLIWEVRWREQPIRERRGEAAIDRWKELAEAKFWPHQRDYILMPQRFLWDSHKGDEAHRESETEREQAERMLAMRFISLAGKKAAHIVRVKAVDEALVGAYNPWMRKPMGGSRENPMPQIKISSMCPMTRRQLLRTQMETPVTERTRARAGETTGRKQRVNSDFTDCVDYIVSIPGIVPPPSAAEQAEVHREELTQRTEDLVAAQKPTRVARRLTV